MRKFAALAAASLGACSTPHGVAEFERLLATHHSATAALTEWCRVNGIAERPEIVARSVKSEMAALTPAIRSALAIGADEPVRYRQVHLLCGEIILSVAENWYVPARLTADMNHALETSDVPFGKVVAPIGYSRELLASDNGQRGSCPDGTVLTVRAVLKRPDGFPISLVAECYTAAILATRG